MTELAAAHAYNTHVRPRACRFLGALAAALLLANCASTASSSASDVTAPSSVKPLVIEHGSDAARVADTVKNAAKIDALPFDGITIVPIENPCSATPLQSATAQRDMAAMPRLTKVTHNFLLCRFTDNAPVGGVTPYDMKNDTAWATIASNLAGYAAAAQATGLFDGVMIDTEYYGTGPNPWDYDTIPIPVDYSKAPNRPWTLPADAKARAQSRGKQLAAALQAVWPNIVLFSLRGAALSDPSTYRSANFGGNDVAWANELAGPFFVGMVEAVAGSKATLVDGGESYYQRSNDDFRKAYAWMKSGLASSGGPIVPSGAVTVAMYKSTVSVASQTMDGDIRRKTGPYTPAQLKEILANASKNTDKYVWLFSELYDWRGTGFPALPVADGFVTAVASSRTSR